MIACGSAYYNLFIHSDAAAELTVAGESVHGPVYPDNRRPSLCDIQRRGVIDVAECPGTNVLGR